MIFTNEVFRRILGALEQSRIPYMLTGSFASSLHGAPRATQDIDVVIDLRPNHLQTLLRAFPPTEYYLSEEAVAEAQRFRSQFNAIDLKSGWKIDFILLKDRAFDHEEFSRRRAVNVSGVPFVVATLEDIIIAKLEWARLGESERQMRDVAKLLEVRDKLLDRPYLAKWIQQLRLEPQWNAACRIAGIIADF